jgi:D-proline reductase (dithiol) PrdB
MQKIVDGFRFVPPSLRVLLSQEIPTGPFTGYIPWTEVKKPVKELTFSLMTSAGINIKGDPPFDMEREKREPMWGDPTCREIPKYITETDIDVNHLHINTSYIKQDIDVMLPVKRFKEFEDEGVIGRLAPTCYSYYGFQLDATELLDKAMPKVAAKMDEEGVEAVLLTPA